MCDLSIGITVIIMLQGKLFINSLISSSNYHHHHHYRHYHHHHHHHYHHHHHHHRLISINHNIYSDWMLKTDSHHLPRWASEKHTRTHTHMHTHTHTYTHKHTVHIYTHTHPHTHTRNSYPPLRKVASASPSFISSQATTGCLPNILTKLLTGVSSLNQIRL